MKVTCGRRRLTTNLYYQMCNGAPIEMYRPREHIQQLLAQGTANAHLASLAHFLKGKKHGASQAETSLCPLLLDSSLRAPPNTQNLHNWLPSCFQQTKSWRCKINLQVRSSARGRCNKYHSVPHLNLYWQLKATSPLVTILRPAPISAAACASPA